MVSYAQLINTVTPTWVKARISDSLAVSRISIATKLTATDTASLSNRINTKLTASNFDDSLGVHFKIGTDSIHYGADSIVVTHGVGSTPSFVSIQLTSNSFGFPIWVNTIGGTTFAVKRDNTGLSTITTYIKFKWMAYK